MPREWQFESFETDFFCPVYPLRADLRRAYGVFMPELPEVEIVKRGLEPVLARSRVKGFRVNRADLRIPVPPELPGLLAGRQIGVLMRRGKYILAFADTGEGFVLHLGMSGRVRIYGPGEGYALERHDHAVFEMEDGSCIVYNDARRFGFIDRVSADNWQERSPFDRMGPEPLDENFSGDVLARAFEGRKMPVKAALLDQSVVAGIGNIYACEALYRSGIAPQRAASSISGEEAGRLAPAIREVLAEAIAAGGSTLRDHRLTDGSLGYFQHRFAVYDREGAACPDCDCKDPAGIVRIVQGGRSTFYCPARQE